MKMEKTNVEFVEFDAKDVITTSTPGSVIPSDLSSIWLSSDSITNFNAMVPTGGYMLSTAVMGNDSWDYYSFTSWNYKDNSTGQNYFASSATGLNKPNAPTQGLYVVNEGNATEYSAVLTWLTTKAGI